MKIKLLAVKNAAEHARIYGICDETAYRDLTIKIEFEQMKIDAPNLSVEELIKILMRKKWAEQFLAYETIRDICYPRGEKKEKMEMAIRLAEEVATSAPQKNITIERKQRRSYPRRRG